MLGFQPAQAAQPIIVVSDTWENFVSEDGSGYYLDLLRMAFPSPQYELKLSILPYSRTLYTIKQQKADIGSMVKMVQLNRADVLLDYAAGIKKPLKRGCFIGGITY